jgi:hypothetical protein
VRGQVSYKGKPVPGGTVRFYPESGGVYTATIGPDGAYSVTDVPAGETGVAIETESAKPHTKTMADYGAGKGQKVQLEPLPSGGNQPASAEHFVAIPTKYNNKKTSGLTVTLAGGKQSHNFDLE